MIFFFGYLHPLKPFRGGGRGWAVNLGVAAVQARNTFFSGDKPMAQAKRHGARMKMKRLSPANEVSRMETS